MSIRSKKFDSKPFRALLPFLNLALLVGLLPGVFLKHTHAQNPGGLTPENAESIIVHSPHFSDIRKKLPLHEEGFLKGLEQGMWTGGMTERDELFTGSTGDPAQLTEQGSDFFQSIEVHPGETSFLILNRSIEPEINILSIKPSTEHSERTEVSFSWRYTDLPSVAKRFAVEGGTGNAVMKQTPEGWLTDRIHVQFSSNPIPLSREEKLEEEKDIARHKAFREQQVKKKEEEKRRVKALMREAKTPTRQIAEFDFDFSTLDVSTRLKRSYRFTAKISDVDIRVEGTEAVESERFDHSYSLWFDHVREITRGFNDESNLHWVKIKSKYGKIAYWASTDRPMMDQVYETLVSARKTWQEKFGQAAQRFPR